MPIKKLVLAEPRGFCAGVERAVQVIDLVLEAYDAPIYCRHEIVHNRHVVEGFEKKGVIFVDEISEVPEGATTIFSAHGVSPAVWQDAKEKNLTIIDATCPLVTKVHLEVKSYAKKGFTIFYIGHRNHAEAVGVMGEAPDHVVLVETVEEAQSVQAADPSRAACLTQTTLSVDDTAAIVDVLKARFPEVVIPPKSDICYATSNRQAAVKKMAEEVRSVLVLGSSNSSNSNRLVEVARQCGADARLAPNIQSLDENWLKSCESLGITSGASTPDILVEEAVNHIRSLFDVEVTTVRVAIEDTIFKLPRELAEPA
jgi:4-hydroxy-3-methylbut-2-enyl diphosphate reductase